MKKMRMMMWNKKGLGKCFKNLNICAWVSKIQITLKILIIQNLWFHLKFLGPQIVWAMWKNFTIKTLEWPWSIIKYMLMAQNWLSLCMIYLRNRVFKYIFGLVGRMIRSIKSRILKIICILCIKVSWQLKYAVSTNGWTTTTHTTEILIIIRHITWTHMPKKHRKWACSTSGGESEMLWVKWLRFMLLIPLDMVFNMMAKRRIHLHVFLSIVLHANHMMDVRAKAYAATIYKMFWTQNIALKKPKKISI